MQRPALQTHASGSPGQGWSCLWPPSRSTARPLLGHSPAPARLPPPAPRLPPGEAGSKGHASHSTHRTEPKVTLFSACERQSALSHRLRARGTGSRVGSCRDRSHGAGHCSVPYGATAPRGAKLHPCPDRRREKRNPRVPPTRKSFWFYNCLILKVHLGCRQPK